MIGWLVCSRCQSRYPLADVRWRCDCGHFLDIESSTPFRSGDIDAGRAGLWRYRHSLPVQDDRAIRTMGEGWTPLLTLPVGKRQVFVKQDHLFPSGSYKDRGAAILISHAVEIGVDQVVEDSSGNAGAAIAAYCALAGIACDIYVPEKTSPGKLAQIERSGARLHRIPGSREDTARAALEAAQTTYYASHSWNPFFFQGTKTFAYEVCEQLGWKSPDVVVLPVGNGTLILGAFLGFKELALAGVVQRMPRLIGVQAENCAPLAAAFSPVSQTGSRETIAEGIAIAQPIRGEQIISAVRESGGKIITVNETQIKTALMEVCRLGYYIEPTSAAALAGLARINDELSGDPVIVTVFTGHGLKATEKMLSMDDRSGRL